MATEAIKSQQITNATATPNVPNPAYQDGGRVRVKRASWTNVLTVADAGSTYRLFKVRSNDSVKSVVVDNATQGGACTADIGLYAVNKDGSIGAVVDADFFASALPMTANVNVNITRENGATITSGNMEKRLWEQLGLTVDPQVEYEVVTTIVVATSAVGAACLTAEVVGGH